MRHPTNCEANCKLAVATDKTPCVSMQQPPTDLVADAGNLAPNSLVESPPPKTPQRGHSSHRPHHVRERRRSANAGPDQQRRRNGLHQPEMQIHAYGVRPYWDHRRSAERVVSWYRLRPCGGDVIAKEVEDKVIDDNTWHATIKIGSSRMFKDFSSEKKRTRIGVSKWVDCMTILTDVTASRCSKCMGLPSSNSHRAACALIRLPRRAF